MALNVSRGLLERKVNSALHVTRFAIMVVTRAHVPSYRHIRRTESEPAARRAERFLADPQYQYASRAQTGCRTSGRIRRLEPRARRSRTRRNHSHPRPPAHLRRLA